MDSPINQELEKLESRPLSGRSSFARLSTGRSIASVTVVYNGANVLQRHLESLKAQTRAIDEIVVVDNSSTDNAREVLATEFPEVSVVSMPYNTGVGGGLAAGFEYALKRKFDWIWIFDQDSAPAPDALENLLAGLQHLGEQQDLTAVLAPICWHPDTGLRYPGLSWQRWGFAPDIAPAGQSTAFVDMVISSGSLMKASAIAEVGLPRSDFFMDFVDYEYCLRLRRHGFLIAVIGSSILEHAIGTPARLNFFGRQKSWTDHSPWREYYMTRNEIFTIWRYDPRFFTKAFVLYRFLHHACGILLLGKRKTECLQMIWRGFRDGLAGRLGIRILPQAVGD